MMIASSTSLGMYPSERMAMPSSCLEMNPLPSRSSTLNASRISAKTNKCPTQHLLFHNLHEIFIGCAPLSNKQSQIFATFFAPADITPDIINLLHFISPKEMSWGSVLSILDLEMKILKISEYFHQHRRPGCWLYLLISAIERKNLPVNCISVSNSRDERLAPSNAYFINDSPAKRKLAAKDLCFKIEPECHASEGLYGCATCSNTQRYTG